MGKTKTMKKRRMLLATLNLVLKFRTPASIITKVQGSTIGIIPLITWPYIISHLLYSTSYLILGFFQSQNVTNCMPRIRAIFPMMKMKEAKLLESTCEETLKNRPRFALTCYYPRGSTRTATPKRARISSLSWL